MKNIITLSCVLVMICVINGCTQEPENLRQLNNEPENRRQFSLADKLVEATWIASKLDCYFTVEELNTYDYLILGGWNEVSGKRIQLKRDIASIDELVNELKAAHKDAVVFRNPTNTAVIHIVHKSLHGNEKHILNQKITFSFDGSPSDLVKGLNKKWSRIQCMNGGTVYGLEHDYDTTVRVRAENQTLRSVLTDGVRLSEYRRLLWVSQTEKMLQQTDVRWKGPYPYFRAFHQQDFPNDPEQPLENPDFFYSFDNGEGAYRGNLDNAKTRKAAMEFIATEMKKKEPRQVRWAMFFLGKHQVEDARPLLLKHLDYRYTTCDLLEESYPAAKALTSMGPQITPFLTESLLNEKDDLRLRLLTKVVHNLHSKRAAEILNELSLTTSDANKRERIQKALKTIQHFER